MKTMDDNEVLKVNDILEYCVKVAKLNHEMADKAINYSSHHNDLLAAAYFYQQAEMYRYRIPEIIKSLVEEKNKE